MNNHESDHRPAADARTAGRRLALLGLAALFSLTACGGGGSVPAPGPVSGPAPAPAPPPGPAPAPAPAPPPPGPTTTGTCAPKTESSNEEGSINSFSFAYTYDASGRLSGIEKHLGLDPSTGLVVETTTIDANTVTRILRGTAFGNFTERTVYDVNIFTTAPALGTVYASFDGKDAMGNDVPPKQYITSFEYDTKGRLVHVRKTVDVLQGNTGAYSDLYLAYDANDNVTAVNAASSSSPTLINLYTATGYDSHPTPFAAISFWSLVRKSWDPSVNVNGRAVLTALSKNNPTGYTESSGQTTLTSVYNTQGYPTQTGSTFTGPNGSSAYTVSYSYECKP